MVKGIQSNGSQLISKFQFPTWMVMAYSTIPISRQIETLSKPLALTYRLRWFVTASVSNWAREQKEAERRCFDQTSRPPGGMPGVLKVWRSPESGVFWSAASWETVLARTDSTAQLRPFGGVWCQVYGQRRFCLG
jgi:hypothetical protein